MRVSLWHFPIVAPTILLLRATARPETPGTAQPTSHTVDCESQFACGANALYVLMKLLGSPKDFSDLAAHLHPGPAGELSMAQLRDAATELGVRLEGRSVQAREIWGLDRPMIVRLEPALAHLHGHFVVCRSLGRSGFVQVIDPPLTPRIIPAGNFAKPDELYSCLVPIHNSRSAVATAIWIVMILLGCGLVLLMLRRQFVVSGWERNVREHTQRA